MTTGWLTLVLPRSSGQWVKLHKSSQFTIHSNSILQRQTRPKPNIPRHVWWGIYGYYHNPLRANILGLLRIHVTNGSFEVWDKQLTLFVVGAQ